MRPLPPETTRLIQEEFEARHRQQLARGRALILAGNFRPDKMLDSLAVIAYWKHQREVVAWRGQCENACQCELITTPKGELVCPNTFQPCDRRRLASIVHLYSQLGSGRADVPLVSFQESDCPS